MKIIVKTYLCTLLAVCCNAYVYPPQNLQWLSWGSVANQHHKRNTFLEARQYDFKILDSWAAEGSSKQIDLTRASRDQVRKVMNTYSDEKIEKCPLMVEAATVYDQMETECLKEFNMEDQNKRDAVDELYRKMETSADEELYELSQMKAEALDAVHEHLVHGLQVLKDCLDLAYNECKAYSSFVDSFCHINSKKRIRFV